MSLKREVAQNTSNWTDKHHTIPNTTAREIIIIMEKTKNNKAPGIDLIRGKILKDIPPKAINDNNIQWNFKNTIFS